jgi:hypothetical protein
VWCKPVKTVCATAIHQFHSGVGIGFTGFLIAVKTVARHHNAAMYLDGLAIE